MKTNKLREKLQAGQPVYGTFTGMDSPDLVELMALAGFDFHIVDTEHGPGNPWSIQHMIRAAECRGMSTVVRAPNHERTSILKVLDIGADGVQVPMVNDVNTAEAVASGAHYAPGGIRGAALMRSADYGMTTPAADYFSRANEGILTVIHCETMQCFESLETIASVPGIDVVFLGPFDLSQSMGIPGQVRDPRVLKVVEEACRIILKVGKIPGVLVTSTEEAQERLDLGYRYILYNTDVGIIGPSLRSIVDGLRACRV